MEKTNRNYDILDFTKYVLSIMIVAIHADIFPTMLYPWLRLAIPLFFIISSFLLYDKVNHSAREERGIIIRKYIIRQLKLYLFWFVVLLPVTIEVRSGWFNLGMLEGVKNMVKNILFSSTFVASWYITATILATLIVNKMSEKIDDKVLLLGYFFVYFICCLVSSYSGFFENMTIIKEIYRIYESIFTSPVFSFPVALLWILIGKIFADYKSMVANKRKVIALLLILSGVLLFIEWKWVYQITGTYKNDCYFFLVPMAILIFYLILPIKIQLKNPKLLRNISTITYPLHASLVLVVRAILNKVFPLNAELINTLTFVTTLGGCYIVCWTILKLENKKYFKLLKYSH